MRPNQALPVGNQRGKQDDQMSVLRFNIASKVFVFKNFIGSLNSVRLVYYEYYQRGSPFRLLGGTRSRPDIVISGRTYRRSVRLRFEIVL